MFIGENLQNEYAVDRSLRFKNPGFERGFKRHYIAKILILNRIALSMALLMYSSFFILDFTLELPNLLMPAFLRLILMPAVILFVFYQTFQKRYRRYFEFMISLPLITGSLAHCVMVTANPLPPGYFVFATALMLLYNYLFSGLRLRFSLSVGLFIVLSYELVRNFQTEISLPVVMQENFFLLSANVLGVVANYLIERFNRADFVYHLERELLLKQLRVAKLDRDELLGNILPAPIVEELYKTGKVVPHDRSDVTVMFIDIVGFTRLSEKVDANQLVNRLSAYFTSIDRIMDLYGIEKLKTIGDAYLCAGGLSQQDEGHTLRCCQAALAILAMVEQEELWFGYKLDVRIGMHLGPVTAGVVGEKKFAYDIWGDTVNVASRIEKASLPGHINLSQQVFEEVKEDFDCEARGVLPIKGQVSQPMYFLLSERLRTISLPKAQ